MARGDDDRVVGRVVVDGVDVSPVAARTHAGDVAEFAFGLLLGELFGGERVAGLRRVDVQAHGALVKGLDHVGAIRVEDVEETPFVDYRAVLVDFDDHVAHRVHALFIGATQVGGGDAQEVVAVLGGIQGVGEVGVGVGQTAVPDLAAHEVVLGVALAEAESEAAVRILVEAHHHAVGIRILGLPEVAVVEEPTDFALRVDDDRLGRELPGHGAAHRVVPDGAHGLGVRRAEVVDEVEAVGELLGDLLHVGLEHQALFVRGAGRNAGDRAGVDRVGELDGFDLALEALLGGHFDLVLVVGVQTEDRHAAVREELGAGDLVGDFLTALLRHDAHVGIEKFIAAVLDDGSERRNAVRIDEHFAQRTVKGRKAHDVVARGGAHGHGAARGARGRRKHGTAQKLSAVHLLYSFVNVARTSASAKRPTHWSDEAGRVKPPPYVPNVTERVFCLP